MELRSLKKEDLVVGTKVVEIEGGFYHVYRISRVANKMVTLDSVYILYRNRKYDEMINGSSKGQIMVSLDTYSDDVIGLINRDLNVNIELLLEEERGN